MFTQFFSSDISHSFSRIFLFAFIAVLPFMGGCGEDDNPIVDNGHGHEPDAPIHADADGVLLKVDGVEVYRQFEETQTGGITLAVDAEIVIEVTFLNPDEEELHLDEIAGKEEDDEHEHDEEEAFSLAVSEYDTTIIEVHLSEEHAEDEDEHDEDEHLSFEVTGLKAGETMIKLQLMHGDHPDFTALPIPVTVE